MMVGSLVTFAVTSAAFVAGGDPHLLGAARFAPRRPRSALGVA